MLVNLSFTTVFFITDTFPVGNRSWISHLHWPTTVQHFFGILALHSCHLGQLSERASTSDVTCGWFSASAGFWCPTGDGSMLLAQHTHIHYWCPYACAHSHIHSHQHLAVTGEHWGSHTSLSLLSSLVCRSFFQHSLSPLLTSFFWLAFPPDLSCLPTSLLTPEFCFKYSHWGSSHSSPQVLFHTQITLLHKEILCLGTSSESYMLGLIKHV